MAEANKTLIVLTPGFPENEADTTCLPFLQGHITAIQTAFPDLEIIILTFQYPYIKGSYKWQGLEVISFDGRERPKIHRLQVWTQVWRKLLHINKEKKVIGLFSLWCTECALIGSYFGKIYGLKHYNWLCGQDAKPGNKYVRLIRPRAEELIAMSDFLKREFYKNHDVLPAHVIPLGVEPSQFSTQHFSRDIDILGVGSLIPLKQYDVFVNVIHELYSSLPSINAMICGKGPEEQAISNEIAKYQLQQTIALAGEVAHDGVLQLMQRTKVFLHTSNYEGFGTVCLEALCAGAHVVSFTKPMDAAIKHWHHVSNIEEMTGKIKEILQSENTAYTPVVPYSSIDVAKIMMKLFIA